GHAVTSIGETVLFPRIDDVVKLTRKTRLGAFIPQSIMHPDDLSRRVQADPVFQAFKADVIKVYPSMFSNSVENLSVGSWRNLAMSIASEQRNTVYRFMFISLLNLGVATVLLLVAVLWVITALLQWINLLPGQTQVIWPLWTLLLIASFPFIERR